MKSNIIQSQQGKINIVLQHDVQKQDHKNENLKMIDHLLKDFIGLEEVKAMIKEIYAIKMMNEKRKMYHLSINDHSMHMIFRGNPGTGKTTIARKLAEICVELQLLEKGHFIEAQRADVVGEYIGQTAIKTKQLVERARGGILFIDEAYALARGGEKDFGKEAIDTIVKLMEDYRDEFILILAGYSNEIDSFLQTNPGLRSRFPFQINFPNYTMDQLLDILKMMAKERDYRLTNSALLKVEQQIEICLRNEPFTFSNARYIRNILERAIRQQAMRMMQYVHYSEDQLTILRADDFTFHK